MNVYFFPCEGFKTIDVGQGIITSYTSKDHDLRDSICALEYKCIHEEYYHYLS